MNQIVVEISKVNYGLIIPLGLFFVPLGIWNLIKFLFYGYKTVPLILGLMMLSVFGLILWLIFNGYRKSVKYFTDEGLMRNDGRQFLWTELSRVVNQIKRKRSGGGFAIWRTEIQFKDGSAAWLIPSKVRNHSEVWNFVNNLPCEHLEKRV